MKNFIFQKGNIKYSLNIDMIKYCLGLNHKEKYFFKQIIIESVNNIKTSEYSKENIGNAKLYIDNKEVNYKDILFYKVSHDYSIQEDLKLSSKSMIAKYLEILIAQEENIDTINSINILLESFGIELENEIVVTKFMTYTPKLFLKILLPMFCFNDEQANEYDLDYNEIILLQLKMIKYISENISEKIVLCLLEIPLITTEIKKCLDELENCYVIVFSEKYESIPNIDDIYFFDRLVFDLSSEDELYNIFLHKGICTIKEARKRMITIIKKQQEMLDMSIFNIK